MMRIVSMKLMGFMVLGLTVLAGGAAQAQSTQWQLDGSHTSIYFKIGHADVSYVYGRFNDVDGRFTLGSNPSFEFTVQANSVDTNNQKRDDHLRSPDFFNVKQFPTITFSSTSVEDTEQGYAVTGDLTLHGTTREITVNLKDMGQTEMPPGTVRHGFATQFTLNRSDYGMDNMLNAVGDEVTLMISFEGVKQ
jgi:polyisoprenoid-binding protein YceI